MKNIKISVLYKEQLKCIAENKLKNFETLNYNNLKPKRGGLFCEKLFGNSNKICKCGKVKFIENKIIRCKRCFDEIIDPYYKSTENSYLNLNSYFINPLFYKINLFYISLILKIPKKNIYDVLFNKSYIIIYSNNKLKIKSNLISFNKYIYYKKKYYNDFFAVTGFEGIKYIIENFDIKEELNNLKNYFNLNLNFKKKDYKDKLKFYEFLNKYNLNNTCINNFFLKKLFVINSSFRPIVKLNNGNIAISEINELYKRLIYRNKRLHYIKKYVNNNFILIFEKFLNQNSLNDLFFDNKYFKKKIKSISSNIKGKLGLFRYNLLGKRVDFSARSVIVPEPNLNLDECEIPYDIAIELFKPFIYNKLKKLNYSLFKSKKLIEKKSLIVKKVLEILTVNYFIILNRAPTLHRLGIQSFKIKLTNDKSIKIHPLVCVAFNADFDGDQMAVHIPLSKKSLIECKTLMLSTDNILNPSNGDFLTLPNKDILLGLFYSSNLKLNYKRFLIFYSILEAKLAYNFNLINLNTRIFIKIKDFFYNKIFETTLGRLLIYNLLPLDISYDFSNKIFKKNELNYLFKLIINKYGKDLLINFSNNLMKLGFYFSTISGLSICIDDMIVSKNKNMLILKSKKIVKMYNNDYFNGFLSDITRKKKILDLWKLTIDIICDVCIKNIFLISYYNKKKISNSLSVIMMSGARGSENQIKQICGVRGLIFYKKDVLDFPVLNNLKEGLNSLEYFFFSHSSRKVLADTSLKTSISGYLTRKLVECCNNVIINNYDCFTDKGIIFKDLIKDSDVIDFFTDRIYGRVILKDLIINDLLLIKKNTLLLNDEILIIKKYNLNFLEVRSPLNCNIQNGVCKLCYGLDLSKNKIVEIGESVGIVAAQSIGEPATQLTMRTFHSGGFFDYKDKLSSFKCNHEGIIYFSKSLKYINFKNFLLSTSNIGKIYLKDKSNFVLDCFEIPHASKIYFKNKSLVKKNDVICEWDSDYNYIISETEGKLIFENFIENYNYIKRLDVLSGKNFYEIINFEKNTNTKEPFVKILNKDNFVIYNLKKGYLVLYNNNDEIKSGFKIIKFIKLFSNSESNITGGLPKIISLFEARTPLNKSFISPFSGKVFIKNNYIFIKSKKRNIKYKVNSNILVFKGQIIYKGDRLNEGEIDPSDILRIYGLEELFYFYSKEIKSIYFNQGVNLNDKHIEIILRQMLKNVIIVNPGKTSYIKGSFEERIKINLLNKLKKNIIYNYLLLGITKSSLLTKSFLSELSFQNTNSVLSNSSLLFRENKFINIKESTMLGKLIPFGLGFYNKILNF